VRHALATPNDTHFGLQWHYPLINLPAAWDLTTGSTSVEVAVIDTGVLLNHPDLQGQLDVGAGFDFVSDAARANDGGGIDANADDPGDGGGLQRSSFHGTHVGGTIGAATNNGSGVAGVAWDVTLVPLRVLGVGGGTSYDIRQAVRYAAGLSNDSGTSHAVDVINLSLGGTGFSSLDQSAYDAARAEGVIVIAAAGNSNSSQLFYPASYDGVVSVSAVDTRKQKAPYSNSGTAVDVAAPGGDTSADRNGDGYVDGVLSTLKDEASGLFNFVFYQGTSMASPHMAGVVALMKAVKPALTPVELDTLLTGGTITSDLGTPGRDDTFGHGLIDARRAVEAVSAAPPDDPILLVTPTGLNLGTSQPQASFQVANGGGGTLSVTSVSESEPWLTVSASSVDGNGLGTYAVNVDRTGLANGTYTGTISVESSAGNASVSVVMAVVSASTGADAGFHYVLVVDPETFDTVEQFDVAASGGQYDYQVANVPAGSYYVFAGSDPDNDFVICGTGEACGAYPTLGVPQLVEVAGPSSDLDFVTGFLQTIESSAASAGPERPRAGLRRLRGRQLAR
jgi:serine protease